MKAYSLLIIVFTCSVCRYTLVKIKPELKKYILKFGHDINYKYEGMLAHSFYRFYVVTKFFLPTINDLKFQQINMMRNVNIYNRKKDILLKLKSLY